MFLQYQNHKHRLVQTGDSTFEFRNPALARQHVNVAEDDPFLNLASSLFDITDRTSYPEPSGKTDRNLVYFTVNGNPDYLSLLRVCIQSIIRNSSDLSKIDFLVIGGSWHDYQCIRMEFPEITLYYHQVKSPKDGAEASMNKLRVFDFPYVTEYQKILFLDCDIVFTQDIQRIFDTEIQDSKIYAAIHKDIRFATHNTPEHNITTYNNEVIWSLKNSGIAPFNAGQFLMLGTEKMKRHFENVRLVLGLWVGAYFFEQSFLNTYFNYNFASDTEVLGEFFCLFYIGDHHIKELTLDMKKNVHYAGSPCDGATKLEWVKRKFHDLLPD